MIKVLLDNIAGIAGETIKLLILIVTGVVLLDRGLPRRQASNLHSA